MAVSACAKYSLIKLLLFIGVNWMKSSKFILNRDKIFDSNMLEEKKLKKFIVA